eukprot:TRINITY_DN6845_c0_g1_i2.p1 TRINITY_DN6845_c0_g1~~TRINITY_DN6845_c0_g1_i2.p1  ORF type:complete len:224 (-),score=36.06 TRINITY_DN6845_c0_g1_i2:123-794(-)
MFFAPMKHILDSRRIPESKKLSLTKIYMDEMMSIHFGQGWDILWRRPEYIRNNVPNEEQYLQMVALKTGVLTRMASRMTCHLLDLDTHTSSCLYNFTQKLGMAFQIQDDIVNLSEPEYFKGKGTRAEDISEGKISLIVIHCLNNCTAEQRNRLIDILCMNTTDQKIIDEALKILNSTKSIEYAQTLASTMIKDAWKGIEDILPNGEAKNNIYSLSHFMVSRTT